MDPKAQTNKKLMSHSGSKDAITSRNWVNSFTSYALYFAYCILHLKLNLQNYFSHHFLFLLLLPFTFSTLPKIFFNWFWKCNLIINKFFYKYQKDNPISSKNNPVVIKFYNYWIRFLVLTHYLSKKAIWCDQNRIQ